MTLNRSQAPHSSPPTYSIVLSSFPTPPHLPRDFSTDLSPQPRAHGVNPGRSCPWGGAVDGPTCLPALQFPRDVPGDDQNSPRSHPGQAIMPFPSDAWLSPHLLPSPPNLCPCLGSVLCPSSVLQELAPGCFAHARCSHPMLFLVPPARAGRRLLPGSRSRVGPQVAPSGVFTSLLQPLHQCWGPGPGRLPTVLSFQIRRMALGAAGAVGSGPRHRGGTG